MTFWHRHTTTALVTLFILSGCATAEIGLTEEQQAAIPPRANTVIVEAGGDLLREVTAALSRQGFVIEEANKDAGIITTGWTEVSKDIMVRARVLVLDGRAEFQGNWKLGGITGASLKSTLGSSGTGDEGDRAEWHMPTPKAAYASLVRVALAVPGGAVSHQ